MRESGRFQALTQMMSEALGFVETRGLVAAIEACDAMLKAAHVRLLARQVTHPALVTICVAGETAAVQAAVDAGARAAERVGRVAAVLVIPRPARGIEELALNLGLAAWRSDRAPVAGGRLALPGKEAGGGLVEPPADLAALAALPVRLLRALARRQAHFPLAGRRISQATREELLRLLGSLLFPTSSR